MSPGIIYNVVVCSISGLTGLTIFFLMRKARKEKGLKFPVFLDLFLLLLGMTWMSVGIRFFVAGLGNLPLGIFIYKWFIGPLTYLHLLPAFYYFGWTFFKKRPKIRLFSNTVFTLIALIAIFTFFQKGFVVPQERTYWGVNIIPNDTTIKIFVFGLFTPAFLMILIELGRRLRNVLKTGEQREKRLFGFALGFFFYALAGIFEDLPFVQGWFILLTRIGVMLGPLTFYLAATWEED